MDSYLFYGICIYNSEMSLRIINTYCEHLVWCMSYPTNTKILKGFVFFQILFVSTAKTQLTKGFHGQTSGGFTLVQSVKFCFELGRKREFLYLISLPQPFGFLPCLTLLVPLLLPYHPFHPADFNFPRIVPFHIHRIQNTLLNTCSVSLVK